MPYGEMYKALFLLGLVDDGMSYTVDEKTGCWNWNGYLKRGRAYQGPRMVFHNDCPVKDDEVRHHTCENQACINPAHRKVITRADHTKLHQPWSRR